MKTGSEFHVGIVGLGSMGMGAALSCVRAGLSTWGADLNSNACATLKEAGACGVSDNAATFAEKLDALLVLVVNATQVKQVLFGEKGVAQHLKPGTAVMVSSTIASADAQEIATALAGFGLEMLDAPVSGGAVKAANGEMTVMASGSDIAFERLAPVLEAVAGKVYRIGSEPGLGSTVKIIHQLLAAYLLFQTANFCGFAFIGTWFAKSFNLSVGAIGSFILLIGVGQFVGSLLGSRLVTWLGQPHAFLLEFILFIIGYVVLPFANSPLAATIILALIYTIGGALLPLFMSTLQEHAGTARSTISALANAVMYLGEAIGGVIGGVLIKQFAGFSGIATFTAVVAVLAMLLYAQQGYFKQLQTSR